MSLYIPPRGGGSNGGPSGNYVAADGTVAMTGTLNVNSSTAGGENNSDSTNRVQLQSFQRWQKTNESGTDTNAHYGELVRLDFMRKNAKAVVAWRGFRQWNPDGSGVGQPETVAAWVGHDYPNDSGDPRHGHVSMEMPDSTGQVFTRMEFLWRDPVTGTFGMDAIDGVQSGTLIRFVNADVVVSTNGATFQIAGDPGSNRDLFFSSDRNGKAAGRRWGLQEDSTAEAGSNAGSDFRINSYSDAGAYTATRFFVKRSNGYVGVGTTAPTRMLDVNSDAVRVRTAKTPASATATGEAGQICWDANYVYVCVATNTWKRSPLTTW